MTQFEQSDWLRSENFINIMIEWKINICGKIYIVTSYEIMQSEKYQKLATFTGTHFILQNCQFLVNGKRYDQNENK